MIHNKSAPQCGRPRLGAVSEIGSGCVLLLAALGAALLASGCSPFADLRDARPDVDPWLIQQAARSRDAALTAPLLGILERRLAGVDTELVRRQAQAAAVAVGDRKNRAALPHCIRLLADADEAIRLAAAEALAIFGGPDALRALAYAAERDSSAWVRARAAGLAVPRVP